jgi:hypothetical protein
MSKETIASKLKVQIVAFLSELGAQLPNEPQLLLARIVLQNQISDLDIMNYFIEKIAPLKDEILLKNDRFFLENNILFESVDSSKVNRFRAIWESDQLNEESKEVIWQWFKSFIILVERYQRL